MSTITTRSPDPMGAIPIIDYNPRGEKLTAASLRQRGYDQNGWPYAPCGILTRPNGFDFNCQRASFSCRRQCLSAKNDRIIEYAKDCPYWINYYGFTKHMSIKQFSRLITETIRGTTDIESSKPFDPLRKEPTPQPLFLPDTAWDKSNYGRIYE